MAALSLPPKTPRTACDELMCVARTEPATKVLPANSTLLILTFGPFADVEDDLGVAGLVAAQQFAAGEGPAVFVELVDDRLAGHLVGDGIERHADAQAGERVEFVVGAAEVLGAVVDDVLDEVGLILDGEDDGDFAVRLGSVRPH